MNVKVAVIGVGAIGSVIALALNMNGIEPYLVHRSSERASHYAKRGIYVIYNDVKYRIRGRHVTYGDLPDHLDIVFICTKAYDFESALNSFTKSSNASLLITCQNGIGSYELACDILGKDRVAALVLNVGSHLITQYTYRYVGGATSFIGCSQADHLSHDLLNVVTKLLNPLVKVEVVDDISPYRWYKLLINAGINPVTSILNAPNSVIVENDYARELALKIVSEGLKVVEKLRVSLPNDPCRGVLEVARSTRNNISSMLQDLRFRGKTEIDFINGAIIRYGERVGVEISVNTAVYLVVKALELMSSAKRYHHIIATSTETQKVG